MKTFKNWMTIAAVAALSWHALSAAENTDGSAELPEAKDILAKFVETIGGEEAYKKIESQHFTGKFKMPAQGIEGDLEIFAAAPNKILIKIAIPSLGNINSGFNGEVAWMDTAMTGPMLMEGAQLKDMKDQADFYSALHSPEDYESMKTVGLVEFNGKKAHEVQLKKKSGKTVTEYFDPNSGLMVGTKSEQSTQFGEMTVTTILEDYKEIDSVKLPTKFRQQVGPIEQVMELNEVKNNVVDPEVFELPPKIKALLE